LSVFSTFCADFAEVPQVLARSTPEPFVMSLGGCAGV
jgi:hypothetical protein